MYVAILMCATLVIVMGLSGLTAARAKLRSATDSEEVVAARFCATAALELALLELDSNPNWRENYGNDDWITAVDAGVGTYTWKLVDEYDGNLRNDDTDPVRIVGMGTVGNAVRIYSVCVAQADTSGNLISNPGFEEGTTEWEPYIWDWSECDIESTGDNPSSGDTCLQVKNRDANWNGPCQDVTSRLQNDVDHEFSAWMRAKDYSLVSKVWLWVETSSGGEWIGGSAGTVATEWTEISVTFHPTWNGGLREARVLIETESSTQDFWLDDVSLVRQEAGGAAVVPGTWRREVLP